MNTSTLPPPRLVQTEKELQQVVGDLATQSHIAVDTESNSLFAYQEQVCLIQFSTTQTDYLVDPLSLPDLSILEPIFQNPDIEKVLHGAEYDILCLRRDFNFKLNNLFDTRVASRTLGWPQSGLNNLLVKVFNTNVNKRYQRANWGKRPLLSEMLDYARYRPAFKILGDKVLLSLAIEMPSSREDLTEVPGMSAGQIRRYGNGILDCIRHGKKAPIPKQPKNKRLSDLAHARYEVLHDWRKNLARKRKVESDIILPREMLREIAVAGPVNHEELHQFMVPLEWRFQEYGDAILDIISNNRGF
jgi:ribonuclease D